MLIYTSCFFDRIEDNFICSEEEQVEQKVFHLWYQWVSFFFVLTLGAFYTPHLGWLLVINMIQILYISN